MVETVAELAAFLEGEGSRQRLRLSSNTHSGAGNWELRWWRGRTLHCLDRDLFPVFPRVLRWAYFSGLPARLHEGVEEPRELSRSPEILRMPFDAEAETPIGAFERFHDAVRRCG
jgi:hypothetical protein